MIKLATREVDSDCARRVEPRTYMFVLASISAATASGPVKIRNLSSTGALITGADLPAAGEAVRLRRGSSSIVGKVMWCHGGRAGLRFDTQVKVADWLPAAHVGQQHVDETFNQLRADPKDASTPAKRAAPPPAISVCELTRLSEALEELAEDLAGDPDVVARYLSKLQTLDIVAQVLRKLAGA